MPEKKTINTIAKTKTPIPEQPAARRVRNFEEVALGYTEEHALAEAERCIQCKTPKCVDGCPVEIDIPGFIAKIAERDYRAAYDVLKKTNALPAVCGRVCPQEVQCEKTCVVAKKLEPVGIGRLERFAADEAMRHGWEDRFDIKPTRHKAAIVGSGPAGLTVAADLARAGVQVTVFEALHMAGGVLKYGIPEFRLPKRIIDLELDRLRAMGVRIDCNKIIGRLYTIPQLMAEHGFETVFVGVGAGYPKFIGIPGENAIGVYSANEYLTRVNLMSGWAFPGYDTPVGMGRRVAVIGAGNTAMDACRVSLRMGAEKVYCVYRRSIKEAPARAEELHHAIEEGVEFHWLTAPKRIIPDERGWAKAMECIKMGLGEPDESGRRRPIEQPGTEYMFEADTIVSALGTQANPIIARTTPGLKTNKWGYIEVDPQTQMTSIPGVFAGGDIVTGAATVILAMGAGRVAAREMLKFMGLSPAS